MRHDQSAGPEGPLYLTLARELEADIRAGRLATGARLPTHRDMSRDRGLARATVRRAYEELERWGLIESTVGRGTFVLGPADGFNFDGASVPESVDLSLNHSPALDPEEIRDAAVRALQNAPADWLDSYLSADRNAAAAGAAERWMRVHGLRCDPANVQFTVGAQQAITLSILATTRVGEAVAVDELTYPSIRQCAHALGRRVVEIETDEDGMDAYALGQACERDRVSAVYITPTLHNPLAITLSAKRRQRLADEVERRGLIVIEDDCLRLLERDAPPPIATLVPDRVIYIPGFSKVVSAGLRIGMAHVPPALAAAYHDATWANMIVPCSASLLFAIEAITSGAAARWAEAGRGPLVERWTRAKAVLGDHLHTAARPSPSLWLDLPGREARAEAVADACAQRGVQVLAGTAFGSGSRARRGIRVCLSRGLSGAALDASLERVANAIASTRDHCRGQAL